MGHAAFRAHVQEVQGATTEDDRRRLIRDRFREALLEATPYCLRLRQDDCCTVLDLVKYNVPELQLPPALQAQVESLLYVAVALATTAKIYHTKRETVQTAKEIFSVPLMYDPRFQRSPFDAMGRSMRLGPLKSLIKNKSVMERLEQKARSIEAADVPAGIWDSVAADHGSGTGAGDGRGGGMYDTLALRMVNDEDEARAELAAAAQIFHLPEATAEAGASGRVPGVPGVPGAGARPATRQ